MTVGFLCRALSMDTATAGLRGVIRPVVVAPSYNNSRTLYEIVNGVRRLGLSAIVINDGSTDATADILAEPVLSTDPARLTVVTHARNLGKAAALASGFSAALQLGFSHAITIDTDGQHDPLEIPALVQAAQSAPDALVLGVRGDCGRNCPCLNQLGWWMSALGIWLETGQRVLDSQCGLRVYPLRLTATVRCRARRFGFETEIITRAAWAGWPIVEAPVTCRYFADDRRVSHFRPWRDGLQAVHMHARLALRRLAPWPSARTPRIASTPKGPVASRWFNPILPTTLWHRLRQDRFEQLVVAAALGMGVFMAALPLAGWQMALAAYAAWRLHVHCIPALVGSLLCLPPLGDGLRRLALNLGHMLCHASPAPASMIEMVTSDHWRLLAQAPIAWPLGGTIIGFVASWITIPVFVRVFRLIPVKASRLGPWVPAREHD